MGGAGGVVGAAWGVVEVVGSTWGMVEVDKVGNEGAMKG
jgi:hypothetical protein